MLAGRVRIAGLVIGRVPVRQLIVNADHSNNAIHVAEEAATTRIHIGALERSQPKLQFELSPYASVTQ
jgi:hypothetical protein